MSLKLIHVLNDYVELRCDGQPLIRYNYARHVDPYESPKPYFHPLWTPAGDEVTLFRPHDHVLHYGLAMTMAQLSGRNFWDGPTAFQASQGPSG